MKDTRKDRTPIGAQTELSDSCDDWVDADETSCEQSEQSAVDALNAYLNEIGKVPRITREQEIALGTRLKEGDDNALAALVQANLRFVVHEAKRYQRPGIQLLDLIQEGNIGLVTAASRYDCQRSSLSTYAVWYIRQNILLYLAKRGWISQEKTKLLNTYERLRQDYILTHGTEPDRAEMAKQMLLTEQEITEIEMLLFSRNTISFDQIEDEETGAGDSCTDGRAQDPYLQFTNAMRRKRLGPALTELTEREAKVVKQHYGLEDGKRHTFKQIGEELHISAERVRQINERALKKLAEMIEA